MVIKNKETSNNNKNFRKLQCCNGQARR